MSTTMDSDGYKPRRHEAKLRELVAKRLGAASVPDVVWEYPEVVENIDAALEAHDPRESWERARTEIGDLVRVVRGLMKLRGTGSHPPPGRRVQHTWNGRYNPHEETRVHTLQEHYARLASNHWDVVRFRFRVVLGSCADQEKVRELGESMYWATGHKCPPSERDRHRRRVLAAARVLTEDEAVELLDSPANAYLSWDQFREWRIPVLGHRAQLGTPVGLADVPGPPDHKGEIVTLTFEDSGETYRLRGPVTSQVIDGFRLVRGRPVPDYPAREGITDSDRDASLYMYIETGQQEWVGELTCRPVQLDFKRTIKFPLRQLLPGSDEARWFDGKGDVWPGSVLDELRGVSEGLAETYRWEVADAVWFVLTGGTPGFFPLRATTTTMGRPEFDDATISIEALPWISSETLLELYKRSQESLLSGDNRPIRRRNLELFRFVESRRGTDWKLPRWRKMRLDWNDARPSDWDDKKMKQKWDYHTEQPMCRDYNRVRKSLLWPDYTGNLHRSSEPPDPEAETRTSEDE